MAEVFSCSRVLRITMLIMIHLCHLLDIFYFILCLFVCCRVRLFHHTACLVLYQLCLEVSSIPTPLSVVLEFFTCAVFHIGSYSACDWNHKPASQQMETAPHGYSGKQMYCFGMVGVGGGSL